ncbi:hypothetical protein N665_0020s0137 [Sinapis alba]|nr:hypothetical protein N665_0020s0137 [Sinapis alba]
MPTPVNTARECLTEEAARALDDAVAIARRRSHAQTTSLHAVSALLAMPSSLLREVCVSRAARSTPYSSRLQFRALELCVGVSLDRLPSSKSTSSAEEDPPPVSNSLMAAIKRSQANQRRHPETYHLQQMHGGGQTTVLKVELKYFVLSILDDPIVNRVFCDAGFRSSDIKLDVLHPPVTQFSSRARCPPLFLCNFPSSDPTNREFPFSGSSGSDENSRRIGQVLCRKEKRNPILVGNCGNEALKTFVDAINGGKLEFLPPEIKGLSIISVEKEISEVRSRANEEMILVKLDELVNDSESGVMLNLGELKVFLNSETDALVKLVLKLSDLLKNQSKKLWFIGCASSNETYTKLLDRFPKIDEDWDLHVLPITSSRLPKSSLMGSFVPFGGFFSSTSDFRVPLSGGGTVNQTLPRCHLCNEKCLQEVAAVVKAGSNVSKADQSSEKLPSWLRVAETELDKGPTTSSSAKAVDDTNTLLASQTTALQKKWDNICQSIHQTPAFPKLGFQTVSPPQLPVQTEKRHTLLKPKPKHKEDLTTSVTLGSPLSCVTTDLGLGVTYASKSQETNTMVTLNSSIEYKYHNDLKSLRESLSREVPWQTEAVNAISQIICECKTNSTRGLWVALLGPDEVGKKKVALALSEILFRDQVNCISVDFGAEHCYNDDKFRGKTVVDYITGEVSRKPHSVVLLENVEKAEFPDQMRLSEAVSTGKLRDSHGRVISMKNVIVVATCGIVKEKDYVIVEPVKFTEERVLNARNWKLQIKLADTAKAGVNKRKHEEADAELRAEKVQRSYLDLNLPVDSLDHETEDSKAWFDGFIEQLDGKVTFKPVDFDVLAKNIQEKIVSHFKLSFGTETQLEIDSEVILQILSASWSSLSSSGEEERNVVVDQWIRSVLAPSFVEARQKYGSNPKVAVKLVASRDLAAGAELPEKVDVM